MSSKYEYQDADKEIIFNNLDEDLTPIIMPLPEPPNYKKIDGYGLKPQDQYWRTKPMPYNLKKLNANNKLTPSQKMKVLESSQEHYREEIEYIRQEWDRRQQGYWFFINGKPYYITGDNYFYLQWWPIEGKLPDFRMRDREYWLWVHLTDQDPYCMGYNYPKGRREGATTRESCKRYLVATSTPFARVGLQSKDDQHAKEVHGVHTLDQFRYYIPFWFKPIWEDDLRNISAINFYSPDTRSHPDFGAPCLQSMIDYRPSNKTAYDGLKLKRLHNDEIGKTKEVNVLDRWGVQRECLVEGSNIIGKAGNTSTVEEMDGAGGKEFKQLCDQSHYEKRNKETGRTTSGLYNFFMPSSEGFGGDMPLHFQKQYGLKTWVDKFGMDALDPETGRPLAERYLLGLRQSYLDSDNIEGWIDQVRKYPLRWKDSWKRKASANNFDLEIIEKRLDYYRNGNPDKQRGDFTWENGIPDTKVIWTASSQGRFHISKQLDPHETNRSFIDDNKKHPSNTHRFVAGSDTYKFAVTKTGRKSLGGGAVFWKYEAAIDDGKPVSDYQSNRFICTYLFKPGEPTLYCEDMLMMCIYYGCKIYPEMQYADVRNHFIRRGYGSYLLFRIDERTGKTEVNPGESTGVHTIDAIFRAVQHHIKFHGLRECHDEWLEQCRDIEYDMGDFDLFAACGYALLGSQQDSFVSREQQTVNIEEFIPTYFYN